MAETKLRVYFDACCFIDLAGHLAGHPIDNGRADHVYWCRKLMDASRDGEIQVFTSAFSVVECIGVRDKNREKVLTPEIQRLFKGMLLSGVSGVMPVQATPLVLERARDLSWEHGLKLGGADAVHIATALDVGCSYFITTDDKTIGKVSNLPKLKKLGLGVLRGEGLKEMLPDEYRQQPLSNTKLVDEILNKDREATPAVPT